MTKKKKNNNKGLKITFCGLLVLVVGLLIACIIMNNEAENNKYANMTIPVYEEDSNYEFSINAKTLSETDEYIFKVVNYKGKSINKKKIKYRIEINNETDSKIEVTMNNDKTNLMKDEKSTILEEKELSNKTKENVYYYIRIKSYNKLNKDDLIYVKIFN